MAGATGLEPATSGVTGRRSKPTELRPHVLNWLSLYDPPATVVVVDAYQPVKQSGDLSVKTKVQTSIIL